MFIKSRGTYAGGVPWADKNTELELRKYFLMEVIAEALRVSKREKKNGLFQLIPKQES